MKNLLLLELVGDDCVASPHERFALAQRVGMRQDGHPSALFWKIWNSPQRMLADELVPGAYELLEHLAHQKWRIVLLTTRDRYSYHYRTTLEWLRMKDLDSFWYELAMRFPSNIPGREWKAQQVYRYGSERTYQRIVYIDPLEENRVTALQQWNIQKPLDAAILEVHSGITPFIHDLALPGNMYEKLLECKQRYPRMLSDPFFETLAGTANEATESYVPAPVDQESPSIVDNADWDESADQGTLIGTPRHKKATKRRTRTRL